jgi:antitoxin (DNA-binding transcriptional repressor) of toxin-antitoxin stability system
MRQINLDDAPVQLDDLVQAAIEGEDIFLVTPDERIIQLVPLQSRIRHPQFGSAKGMFTIGENFDDPLDDFNEYM